MDAPTGSWGSSCAQPNAGSRIVYTGAGGTQWRTYPDCYLDTYQRRPYRSDAVLSVHDGVLDFHLRNVNGQPAGANPSPVLDPATGSQYQTYGRYSARFRVTAPLPEYHIAWLLWPEDDAVWRCAESDFPESSLGSSRVHAFHHHGCRGGKDQYTADVDYQQWNTFTQEWAPRRTPLLPQRPPHRHLHQRRVRPPPALAAADRDQRLRHQQRPPARGLGGGLLLPAMITPTVRGRSTLTTLARLR